MRKLLITGAGADSNLLQSEIADIMSSNTNKAAKILHRLRDNPTFLYLLSPSNMDYSNSNALWYNSHSGGTDLGITTLLSASVQRKKFNEVVEKFVESQSSIDKFLFDNRALNDDRYKLLAWYFNYIIYYFDQDDIKKSCADIFQDRISWLEKVSKDDFILTLNYTRTYERAGFKNVKHFYHSLPEYGFDDYKKDLNELWSDANRRLNQDNVMNEQTRDEFIKIFLQRNLQGLLNFYNCHEKNIVFQDMIGVNNCSEINNFFILGVSHITCATTLHRLFTTSFPSEVAKGKTLHICAFDYDNCKADWDAVKEKFERQDDKIIFYNNSDKLIEKYNAAET